MTEPYLLVSARMTGTSPERLSQFAEIMTELETALSEVPVTELKDSGVYLAELTGTNAVATWRRISQLLSGWDAKVGDDLQWFVHLADREGCELSFN